MQDVGSEEDTELLREDSTSSWQSCLSNPLDTVSRLEMVVAVRRDINRSQGAYLSRSFAYLAGTARFDPPKSLSTAKFMPITFPSRLKSGPPEPPEVVAAS